MHLCAVLILSFLFCFAKGVIPAGVQSNTDLFVHCFELSWSEETSITIGLFIFEVGSLEQLVRMETRWKTNSFLSTWHSAQVRKILF